MNTTADTTETTEIDTIKYEHLLYEVDEEHVAWVTLNRPEKLNAMNRLLIEELKQGLLRADADPNVNVIVIRGNGRGFCAGFDLSEEATDEWDSIYDYRAHYLQQRDDFTTPWTVSKPTIASIHKYAIGKGFEMSLFCDISIVTSDVVMSYQELRHGLAAHCMFLPWVVNMKTAKELILTGRQVDAVEAKQLGLVTKVVEPEDLAEETRKMATLMARMPRESQRLHKQYLNNVYEMQGLKSATTAYIDLLSLMGMQPEPVTEQFYKTTLAEGLKKALIEADARFENL